MASKRKRKRANQPRGDILRQQLLDLYGKLYQRLTCFELVELLKDRVVTYRHLAQAALLEKAKWLDESDLRRLVSVARNPQIDDLLRKSHRPKGFPTANGGGGSDSWREKSM
jgi:hypothetical protein